MAITPIPRGAGGRLQISRRSRVVGDLLMHMMRVTAKLNPLTLSGNDFHVVHREHQRLNARAKELYRGKMTPKRRRRRVFALKHEYNALVNKARKMEHGLLWDDLLWGDFDRATTSRPNSTIDGNDITFHED